MSSRHRGRTLALMCLYQMDLVSQTPERALKFDWYDKPISDSEKEYATFLVKGVSKNQKRIDELIQNYSKNWDFSRISVVNRCILRLSLLSFIKEEELPGKVVLDEAIELTKEFETEESVQFINGILDAIGKQEFPGKI